MLNTWRLSGGMGERFNPIVLKTIVPQGTVSSNLTPSATNTNSSNVLATFLILYGYLGILEVLKTVREIDYYCLIPTLSTQIRKLF